MQKFMVLYHAPADVMGRNDNLAPEELAKAIDAWMQWAHSCGDKLTELGTPLGNGQALYPDGAMKPSTKGVSGYSILQGQNAEEIKELLKGHPHLQHPGTTIEIHEMQPIPGI